MDSQQVISKREQVLVVEEALDEFNKTQVKKKLPSDFKETYWRRVDERMLIKTTNIIRVSSRRLVPAAAVAMVPMRSRGAFVPRGPCSSFKRPVLLAMLQSYPWVPRRLLCEIITGF